MGSAPPSNNLHRRSQHQQADAVSDDSNRLSVEFQDQPNPDDEFQQLPTITEMTIEFCRKPLHLPTTFIAVRNTSKPMPFPTTPVAFQQNLGICS
jgi:hypothetical protein